MTGEEVLSKAMKLLGYTNNQGNVELAGRVRSSAADNINIVYADLSRIEGKEFTPITSLDQRINLPDIVMYDCFVYGLAMNIARSEYDTDNQREFAILYNNKRLSLTKSGKREDVIPRSCDE